MRSLEIEPRNVAILLAKELRAAWRNRWFLLYSSAFAVLALAMSWLSLVGAAGTGFAGLGRTAASLVNLVVLIVPLMGLSLGAAGIAHERESGSFIYLLSQPVGRLEVVLGKFLGLGASVIAALLMGFGIAALVIARRVGDVAVGPFVGFLALAALVALAAVSVGLLVSALAKKSSLAAGVSLILWLVFVLLGDLGIMGTSLMMRLGTGELLLATLINPLQQFKLAAILTLRGGLEVLGPAGLYATRTYGDALLPMLAGGLILWILLPLAATILVIERRGAI